MPSSSPPIMPPSLGAYLRQCRGEMSQVDLAVALGVEQPTVSRWERDEVVPTLSRLADIARVLPAFLVPVAAMYARPTSTTDAA